MRKNNSSHNGKDISVENPPCNLRSSKNNDELVAQLFGRLIKKIDHKSQLNKPEKKAAFSPDHEYLDQKPASKPSRNLSGDRQFGKSIRRLLKLVSEAFLNPIQIPWDVEEYYRRHVKGGQDRKRIKFPNPHFGSHSEPLTLVDSKGRIVLWYLPHLFPSKLQSDIRQATRSINPLLKRSIKMDKPDGTSPNWRINYGNFKKKSHSRMFEPGAVTFSSGWFGQGHETEEYDLLPSLNLRTTLYLGGPDCIRISREAEIFLNFTLSLIHPDLYKMGHLMLQKLRNLEMTKDVCQNWWSVYNGIAIISNRLTPSHRDSKGRPEWFDALLSYSDNLGRPRLLIEDLGLDLNYSTGTVVGFCGSIFKHEVRNWGLGERVCYAHFMRESVRRRLDVEPAGWVKQNVYFSSRTDEAEEDLMDIDDGNFIITE